MSQFSMKTIHVRDAVGSVLCQDITRIVVGESKGPVFRKGHVVREEDIPVLLDVGKEHLYVYEACPGMVHENDAAWRIVKATAGENLEFSEPKEGRINYKAACDGLLRVDVETLAKINTLGEISLATLHSNELVKKGQPVAGTRVIPLVIDDAKLVEMEKLVQRPVVSVRSLASPLVGIVTTGSEVYAGRIKDAFGPVLRKKFSALGCPVAGQTITNDEVDMTADAIRAWADKGCGMIVVTGGMSVDPDDNTPSAIAKAGAKVEVYGSPVFPGAMFLLAYMETPSGTVPVLGLPGCVMYVNASIFELVVPRLLAGERLTASDIGALGHGGFCRGCATCHYPVCGFGK